MATPAWEELVQQLDDPNPKTRRRAVRQLAETSDPAVVPYLRNVYLKEEDERVRSTARDALAMFKAMQSGEYRKPFPIGDAVLGRVLRILAIFLLISLLANGALVGVDALRSEDDPQIEGTPTDRVALTGALRERLDQAWEDIKTLRLEIGHHNETDEVVCEGTYHRPQPYPLLEVDQHTYRDLAPIAVTLNGALTALGQPQATWDAICAEQSASLTQGLEALKQIDHVAATLGEVSTQLDEAIQNPMPTPGPSLTTPPTITDTPTPTETPIPGRTAEAVEVTSPTPVSPTTSPSITPTQTLTVTPSVTPTPSQTPLPFPELDYETILRSLSERFIVLGDLQNSYGTGMINYWQQTQKGELISTNFCTLPTWPTHFFWDDAQRAELGRPDAADPELEEAVRLVNEGLDRALQARALFESSCPSRSLSSTAAEGLRLAEEAFAMISEAQQIIDRIRGQR